MDLFEALARRRACRHFTKEPVSAEDLQKLVYAAGRAPTASNRPYRHCILVDDPRVIRAIRQISPSLVADPPVLTGVPAAVLAISLLASFVPAWRAMRANPVDAMRVE